MAGQLARERVDRILGRPARDHEVEAQDEEGGQHAVVADEAPAAVERVVSAHGIAARRAADGELGHHDGESQQQYATYIYQQEGSAAVLSGDVGEAPDVAQPYGAPGGDQHGAQFAAQCDAMVVCHGIL